MHIGVPKEVKVHEHRVGLSPDSAAELAACTAIESPPGRAGAGPGCAASGTLPISPPRPISATPRPAEWLSMRRSPDRNRRPGGPPPRRRVHSTPALRAGR